MRVLRVHLQRVLLLATRARRRHAVAWSWSEGGVIIIFTSATLTLLTQITLPWSGSSVHAHTALGALGEGGAATASPRKHQKAAADFFSAEMPVADGAGVTATHEAKGGARAKQAGGRGGKGQGALARKVPAAASAVAFRALPQMDGMIEVEEDDNGRGGEKRRGVEICVRDSEDEAGTDAWVLPQLDGDGEEKKKKKKKKDGEDATEAKSKKPGDKDKKKKRDKKRNKKLGADGQSKPGKEEATAGAAGAGGGGGGGDRLNIFGLWPSGCQASVPRKADVDVERLAKKKKKKKPGEMEKAGEEELSSRTIHGTERSEREGGGGDGEEAAGSGKRKKSNKSRESDEGAGKGAAALNLFGLWPVSGASGEGSAAGSAACREDGKKNKKDETTGKRKKDEKESRADEGRRVSFADEENERLEGDEEAPSTAAEPRQDQGKARKKKRKREKEREGESGADGARGCME